MYKNINKFPFQHDDVDSAQEKDDAQDKEGEEDGERAREKENDDDSQDKENDDVEDKENDDVKYVLIDDMIISQPFEPFMLLNNDFTLECSCLDTIRYFTNTCWQDNLEECSSCDPLQCKKKFLKKRRDCKKFKNCSAPHTKPTTPPTTNTTSISPTDIPQKNNSNLIIGLVFLPFFLLLIGLLIFLNKKYNCFNRNTTTFEGENIQLSNIIYNDGYETIN